MPLTLDPQTGKIFYKGRIVGSHNFDNGKSTVRLDIEYIAGDDWMDPIAAFASSLARIIPEPERKPDLSISTSDEYDEIAENALVFITEKHVSVNGHVWEFHKSDADIWPSLLHGHDYENALVLDALTGDVYDKVTKSYRHRLKSKDLLQVQKKLKNSKDFKERWHELTPNSPD